MMCFSLQLFEANSKMHLTSNGPPASPERLAMAGRLRCPAKLDDASIFIIRGALPHRA